MGAKLKTVDDLMLVKNKIPFIDENTEMKDALKIITRKKLGILIAKNTKGETRGIVTDGQIRRIIEKNKNLHGLKVKNIMTKNPISIDSEMLAIKAISIMNDKKITSLLVHKSLKKKTVGIIHIHNILAANIQ